MAEDSHSHITEVINLLNIQFALKHPRVVNYFLGIDVSYTSSSYLLSQSQYILDLLNKHILTECNPCSRPMFVSLKLSKDQGVALDNPTIYRSAVGALQFLTLTSLDIVFLVNKLS